MILHDQVVIIDIAQLTWVTTTLSTKLAIQKYDSPNHSNQKKIMTAVSFLVLSNTRSLWATKGSEEYVTNTDYQVASQSEFIAE